MKQQILESRISNAKAALGQALIWLEKGDIKHASDYLVRGIELLKGDSK